MKSVFILSLLLAFLNSCSEQNGDSEPEVELVIEYLNAAKNDTTYKEFIDIEYVNISEFSTFNIDSYTDKIAITPLTAIDGLEGNLIVFIFSRAVQSYAISVLRENSGFTSNKARTIIGTVLPLFVSDEIINHGNIQVDLEIKTNTILDTVSFMSKTNSIQLMPWYSYDFYDLLPDTTQEYNFLHITFSHKYIAPAYVCRFNINSFGIESALELSKGLVMSMGLNARDLLVRPYSISIIKFEE